jgi:hypothetical protein
MKKAIVSLIKPIPLVYPVLKSGYYFLLRIKSSFLNLKKEIANNRNRNPTTESMPIFRPWSAGDYKLMSKLTLLSANQTFPLMAKMATDLHGELKTYSVREFWNAISTKDEAHADQLKEKFNFYGSDKATMHDYYMVYAAILSTKKEITGLLEIGMGTNNEKIASNMSKFGKPGASLRAFRDFLPTATIYGADFDKNILFEEERIKSFFVDQTDAATFIALSEVIPNNLDIIIDDGLHAPNANIATLSFALEKLKNRPNSWIVIEDIPEVAASIWHVVAAILPSEAYRSYLIKSKASYMFVCNKISN